MATHPALLQLRLWQLGVPAFAVLVGLVTGLSPRLGLAAALGVAFVALVLSDLTIGLALFIVVAFVEGVADLGSLSLPKLAGGLLVLSWLASRLTDDEQRRELTRDHPALVAVAIATAGWVTMSAVWAEIPSASLGAALRWIPNLALLAIVYAAVRRPAHVYWIYVLFVIGAFLSALAGALTGTVDPGDAGRLTGSGVNPNGLGELLAVAVIFGGALAACRDVSGLPRAVALSSAGVALILLLLTASRGALLGLMAALLLAPLIVGPGRRIAALVLALLAFGCASTYLAAYAPPETVAHLFSSDASGSGRTDVWKVGWRMVEANAIVGVGAENFGNSTIHYLLEPGTIPYSEFIVDEQKVAHNVYLQVVAELGIVGLALFLGILALSLGAALKAARSFARTGERSLELLTRALLLALTAILVSEFFGSGLYSKQMWVLLGMCVALRALSRRAEGQAGRGTPAAEATFAPRMSAHGEPAASR